MARIRARGAQRRRLAVRSGGAVRRGRALAALLLAATPCGCATAPDFDGARSALAARGLGDIEREQGEGFALPPSVDLDDGLDEEEAVGIALWNDSGFRQALAALRLRRADAIEAGLLPNPTLQLLFPVGPKQFEGMLGWAFDGLWLRPRRVDAAEKAWRAGVQTLAATAMGTRASVRRAFVAARLARGRASLAEAGRERFERLEAIAAGRASRGEVDELEHASRRADAVRARELAIHAQIEADDARWRLRHALGADASLVGRALAPAPSLAAPDPVDVLREAALETHPEIEAARLELEAAAGRLGWERANLIRLTALLDANSGGEDGFEIGPGLDVEVPIFDRNQAGIARAEARLEHAAWGYAGKRREIWREVTRRHAAYTDALAALGRWRRETLAAFEREVALSRAAERAGVIPYTDVLSTEIRWIDARAHAAELEARARRAQIDLETSVGRRLDAGS